MTRMAQERDSILRIHAKVDSYDELEEKKVANQEPASHHNFDGRIYLCSVQKAVRMKRNADIASEEVSFRGFTSKLTKFLQHECPDDRITEARLNVCSVSFFFRILKISTADSFLLDFALSLNSCAICLPYECISEA